MSTWTYIQTKPLLWTVGFYDSDGKWQTDSDHDNPTDAARWVAYLNRWSSDPAVLRADGRP